MKKRRIVLELGLKNKRAIVGGSSKGLGLAVARALLEEGASVVISARNGDTLEQAADTATTSHLRGGFGDRE